MPTLTVSVPAASRALLTAAQLRVAAGLSSSDTSRDAELAAIGLTAADIITDWCGVAGDGITPTTLLRETLVETFRQRECVDVLILARRFLGSVTVVEDGVTLDAADFSIDAGPGMLTRLRDDRETLWSAAKIVVTYQAGFPAAPTPLADVAAEMVARRTGASRDPLMKRERIDIAGVREVEREFWANAENDADITPDMAAKLAKYATLAQV